MRSLCHNESPILLKISFNKLLRQYETLLNSDDTLIAAKASNILKIADKNPILREGFSDVTLLETYKNEINYILQDSFNPILTNNEIKAASIPFEDVIFNTSDRLKRILKDAGDGFELKMKNIDDDEFYIMACSVILNFCYGYNLNFKRPFLYEIPDKNGIMRYYKILYNADFTEFIPTKDAPKITQEDYDLLIDNFDNIDLWKEKFPKNSYLFKGFVISSIFDVTDDQSISNVKSNLIKDKSYNNENLMDSFQEIFRSLFGLKDIKVGFSSYNKEDNTFEKIYASKMESYLLNGLDCKSCDAVLCSGSYNHVLLNNKFYAISDVDKKYEITKGKIPQIKSFKQQGIKSVILAPIADNDNLLGLLEIVSKKPKVLNSINANKLADVMPFIVASVLRSKREENNLIEAIIQKECTSIHPSVHWKFEKEAKNFIREQSMGNQVSFNKIAFEDIYPLYGQIDIKGSSEARNWATKQDLTLQLSAVKNIIEKAIKLESLPIYEQFIYQINTYLEGLQNFFQVDSEQQITEFLKHDINPLFKHLSVSKSLKSDIDSYLNSLDPKLDTLYFHRKEYDDTIASINKKWPIFLIKSR